MEPSGFSQPQGISPDGEIMQPPLVAEVLVAVPPPLFGAQAQQSPERGSLGEHDRLGPQRHAGSAQGSPQHPSHDDGHRPLSSQGDEANYSANFGFGYVGLQGTRPHQVPLTSRSREARMPEAFDASRDLDTQGHTESGLGPELDTSGTYSTPEPRGKALRAENGALAIPARKPEEIEPEIVRLRRNDLRRARDDRSNAEISMSSARSSNWLEKYHVLRRARDLAQLERERMEAQEKRLEAQKCGDGDRAWASSSICLP